MSDYLSEKDRKYCNDRKLANARYIEKKLNRRALTKSRWDALYAESTRTGAKVGKMKICSQS